MNPQAKVNINIKVNRPQFARQLSASRQPYLPITFGKTSSPLQSPHLHKV